MLNDSTVYSSLDCASEYCHITPSPMPQKKSAFVIPISTIELKKAPFGLAQGSMHFQQLISKVLKGLPFVFGY